MKKEYWKKILLYPSFMIHTIIIVHLVLFKIFHLTINIEYTILLLVLIILLDIIMLVFKDMFLLLLEIQYIIFLFYVSLHYILLGGFDNNAGFLLLYAIVPIGILSLLDIRKKEVLIKTILYITVIFIFFLISYFYSTYFKQFFVLNYQFTVLKDTSRILLMRELLFTSNTLLFSCTIFIRLFLISNRNRRLEKRAVAIVYDVIPKEIGDEIISDTNNTSTLERFDSITLLFTDIVAFTKTSSKMDVNTLINALNTLFLLFDEVVEKYGLEKIKTIGDAYIIGTGLHTPNEPQKLIDCAHELLEVKNKMDFFGGKPCQLTTGIYTGDLYAGILGKKYFYDIWGDAIEQSEFYGSLTPADTISISQSVLDSLPKDTDIEYTKIAIDGAIDDTNKTYRYQLITPKSHSRSTPNSTSPSDPPKKTKNKKNKPSN